MQRAKETGFMWTIYYHWTWLQFAKQKKSNKIKRRKKRREKRREIKTFAWLFFEFIWIIDGCTGVWENVFKMRRIFVCNGALTNSTGNEFTFHGFSESCLFWDIILNLNRLGLRICFSIVLVVLTTLQCIV